MEAASLLTSNSQSTQTFGPGEVLGGLFDPFYGLIGN